MSWPAEFVQTLRSGRYEPRYVVEHVKIPAGPLRIFGGNVRLSSFPTQSYSPVIGRDASRFSGGVLSLRDWSASPQTFDVGILGESFRGRDIRQITQRGQGLALKLGFGSDPTEFQPIALGTVYGISRNNAGWALRCKGLEGSLSSRITTTAAEQVLGWELSSTTTSGGVSNGADPINVASTAGFETDATGTGCIRITANDGSTYYVTYTGTTATTFTGTTFSLFGTSHAPTGGGNDVQEVMYTTGHPARVIARVLASTGTNNANGTFDTLPESWGLGVPQEYINERDILQVINETQPATGVDNWHWVQDEPIANIQETIAAWMNGGGYFLTQHRGQLTVRAGVLPWDFNTAGHFTLEDRHIARLTGYDAWDPDSPVEYEKTRMLYADGTTASTSASGDLDHIPSRELKEHLMGGVWSDTTNEAAITSEITGRLQHWDRRTPEILSLELHGWWPSKASIGDTVDLQIDAITSRTGRTFRGQSGLITRMSSNWFGSSTQCEIAILPPDEVVPWRVQPI